MGYGYSVFNVELEFGNIDILISKNESIYNLPSSKEDIESFITNGNIKILNTKFFNSVTPSDLTKSIFCILPTTLFDSNKVNYYVITYYDVYGNIRDKMFR